jgi:hypothetical protein
MQHFSRCLICFGGIFVDFGPHPLVIKQALHFTTLSRNVGGEDRGVTLLNL